MIVVAFLQDSGPESLNSSVSSGIKPLEKEVKVNFFSFSSSDS